MPARTDGLGKTSVVRLHSLRDVRLLHEIGSEKHEHVGRSQNVALELSFLGRFPHRRHYCHFGIWEKHIRDRSDIWSSGRVGSGKS